MTNTPPKTGTPPKTPQNAPPGQNAGTGQTSGGRGARRGAVRGLFAQPGFGTIWTVGGLTGVVRWFQLLAFGVYSFEITGSPLLVSTIPILWMLPLTIGPLVGVISEQVNRKAFLLLSLVLIGILQVVMAGLAHQGALTYPMVALASLLGGIFWASDMPLRRRVLGDLAGERISAAMGLDAATGNTTRMVGPLLGGVVLQALGMFGVFALSAVLYAVCLAAIIPTVLPKRIAAARPPSFLRDLAGGVRFAVSDERLRRILAVTIIFNLWGFPFTSMIPIIGRDELHLTPFLVGMLSSMEGLGALIGALLVVGFAAPRQFFAIYAGGTGLYLVMIFALAFLIAGASGYAGAFPMASVALVIIGIAGACFSAMQGTLTYLAAPPEYRSRVLGVLTLCIGTGPIGFFNVGWLAETFDVTSALAIIACEGLIALLALWGWGAVRSRRK